MKSGQHRTGYVRKKKTQKTKETQYIDADDHPVHSNEISHSRMIQPVAHQQLLIRMVLI